MRVHDDRSVIGGEGKGEMMSKQIAIIKHCWDCNNANNAHCRITGEPLSEAGEIPDWCPLVPMPERNYKTASWLIGQAQKTNEDVDYWRGYAKGWNSCLDEIEGGNEDD